MKNMIKAPTRITQETESLIDMIISTSEEKVTKSGIYDTGIADHCLIYAVNETENLRQKREPSKIREVSNIKNCNWEKFREEMQMAPWSVCSIFEDIDDCSWAWKSYTLMLEKDLYLKDMQRSERRHFHG